MTDEENEVFGGMRIDKGNMISRRKSDECYFG
jgi:hypothetical protein